MTNTVRYTDEEMAVIDGVIGRLYLRMSEGDLRKSYYAVHEHLQNGSVGADDIRCIKSVLDFVLPDYCSGSRMEEQHTMTSLMLKTQTMLRSAEA